MSKENLKKILENFVFERRMAPITEVVDFLVHLYDEGATTKDTAIVPDVPESTLKELAEAARIERDGGKVWLTELGFLIADGEKLLRAQERRAGKG